MKASPGETCDDEDIKIYSPTFHRTNSLPVPCGINAENRIREKNRGSIGDILGSNPYKTSMEMNNQCQQKGK